MRLDRFSTDNGSPAYIRSLDSCPVLFSYIYAVYAICSIIALGTIIMLKRCKYGMLGLLMFLMGIVIDMALVWKYVGRKLAGVLKVL